jgi:hypothetical protein
LRLEEKAEVSKFEGVGEERWAAHYESLLMVMKLAQVWSETDER